MRVENAYTYDMPNVREYTYLLKVGRMNWNAKSLYGK